MGSYKLILKNSLLATLCIFSLMLSTPLSAQTRKLLLNHYVTAYINDEAMESSRGVIFNACDSIGNDHCVVSELDPRPESPYNTYYAMVKAIEAGYTIGVYDYDADGNPLFTIIDGEVPAVAVPAVGGARCYGGPNINCAFGSDLSPEATRLSSVLGAQPQTSDFGIEVGREITPEGNWRISARVTRQANTQAAATVLKLFTLRQNGIPANPIFAEEGPSWTLNFPAHNDILSAETNSTWDFGPGVGPDFLTAQDKLVAILEVNGAVSNPIRMQEVLNSVALSLEELAPLPSSRADADSTATPTPTPAPTPTPTATPELTTAPTPEPSASPAVHPVGDANCDYVFNNFDIDCFVLAVVDQVAWRNQCATPDCDISVADSNQDRTVNNFDIDGFVCRILGGSNC